ncbi:hypothetical protein Syun_029674 [Stephania yunnanensis]|uniref:Uncharacterized protein n=1 Tax=Stephania yunnanensis TaxID=152371 RepID=A0AAP0E5U4_9MAGN
MKLDTFFLRLGAKLQRGCQELTQATLDQPMDDEAVYYNMAGECPRGRVYGLGSLRRKKRIYADPELQYSWNEHRGALPVESLIIVDTCLRRFAILAKIILHGESRVFRASNDVGIEPRFSEYVFRS